MRRRATWARPAAAAHPPRCWDASVVCTQRPPTAAGLLTLRLYCVEYKPLPVGVISGPPRFSPDLVNGDPQWW